MRTGTHSGRQEWQGTRKGGSSKVNQRRENKVSTGDYKNSTGRGSSAAISADCTLPLLSSGGLET